MNEICSILKCFPQTMEIWGFSLRNQQNLIKNNNVLLCFVFMFMFLKNFTESNCMCSCRLEQITKCVNFKIKTLVIINGF